MSRILDTVTGLFSNIKIRVWTIVILIFLLSGVVALQGYNNSVLAASATKIIDSYGVVNTTAQPGIRKNVVFTSSTSTFNYSGGYVLLSSTEDGSGQIWVDDVLRLTISSSGYSNRVVEFPSYATYLPPADVTALFTPGDNTVFVELVDRMTPNYGTFTPFYLASSDTAPTFPTLIIEPMPAGTQFNRMWFVAHSNDPVNTQNGSYAYSFIDIAIAGRGPSPVFERSYNSNDTRVSSLGPGWTHNYATRLRDPGDGTTDIILVGPTGRSDRYTNSGGTYTPPPGVYTALVKNGDSTYTATQKDQTTWTFNALGNLIRIEDRYGNISFLTYDADNRLSEIGDPAGRGSLKLSYNADGLLESVSDWMTPPRVVRYAYDSQKRLRTVTDREGQVTTYGYDGVSQRITSILDANNHTAVVNTYDLDGRVVSQWDARGLVTGQKADFAYTTNGDGTKLTTITYPSTSYETSWRLAEEDSYDSQGRLTKKLSKPTSNSAEWINQEYTYDASSNLASLKDGRGNTTRYCYDVDYSGAPIPGSKGNLTRQIEPAAQTGGTVPVTLLKYDGKNNLVQSVPPKGVNSGTSVDCATNLNGAVNATYASDMAYDAETKTKLISATRRYTDPDTSQIMVATTKYEYGDPNNAGLPTKVIQPRGNTGPTPDNSFASTMTYYGAGSNTGMLKTATDQNGNTSSFEYDAVGRQTKMVDANGNASGATPGQHTWEFVYDKEDRVRFVKAPAPQASGAPLVTESRYDAVGNRVAGIDANGQVTKYLYDERDNLKEVHESTQTWTNPDVPPSSKTVTEYQYDHLGNLSRVTRAKGDSANERVVDYVSDGLGRTRRETQYPNWPSTSATLVTESSYDQNSNRTALKDPQNRFARFEYDALNQLKSILYDDPNTPDVAYTYDLNGNRTSMVDNTGTTTYRHDELDRMLSVTSPSPDGPNTVGYRYDLDGNRTKLIYPSGNAVTYTYDNGNRLASMRDWENRVTAYGYFPDGSLKAIFNSNDTMAEYKYDNAQRLTEVWNRLGSGTISKHNHTMDSVGNRTRVDEVLPENGVVKPPDPKRMSTATYEYDRLYQLKRESRPEVTATYEYDPVGNRVRLVRGKDTITYAYDRADRIKQEGSITYVVDASGNVVQRGKETYEYDQANRLVNSRMPQPTLYVYDGDGKRVSTNAGPGPIQTHVYDVNRPLPMLLYDGRRQYVYGMGLAYAVDGNGQLEIYHTDGLGSVRAVSYANGNVVQNYLTDAFGVVVKTQGSHNQPFQYAGEERDKETELYYLRARYYDPRTGRFMQRDPFAGVSGSSLSLNRHLYTENNPVNWTDPSGKFPLVVAIIGIGAVVGGVTNVIENAHEPGADTSFWGYTKAFGIGAFSGAVGTGVGLLTRNPLLGGVAGSVTSQLVENLFEPQPWYSDLDAAAVGGLMVGGPLTNRLSFPLRGAIPELRRSVFNAGKNTYRWLANTFLGESLSWMFSGLYRSIRGALLRPGMESYGYPPQMPRKPSKK